MTENTQTSLLSEICALTSRIKGAICAQVAAVAVSSYGHGVYVGVRKMSPAQPVVQRIAAFCGATGAGLVRLGNAEFGDNKNDSHSRPAPQTSRRQSPSHPVPGFVQPHVGFAVLERYHRELLNFLTRQVKDRDTAADLAQESYLRVLAAQTSGQAVLDMRALLYRTARNLVIDQHRRNLVRRHDALHTMTEDQHPQAPQHLQPEEVLASSQVIRAYVATIEALPARCREAFVLHVFDEISHAQIAQHMGISISMVEKHVVRGMVACKLCERRLREPVGPAPQALS